MRKRQALKSIITLCLFATGCGTKVTTSAKANEYANTIEELITQAPEETSAETREDSNPADAEKPKLSHNEKLTYSGYMDAVDESWFGTRYEFLDYDNDGLPDRVYRESSYSSPEKIRGFSTG